MNSGILATRDYRLKRVPNTRFAYKSALDGKGLVGSS